MSSTPMTLQVAPQRRARLDEAPRVCWCGQDLDYAHPGHCPRCGAAREARPYAMAPAA